ncbi:hypothetical protein PIB30_100881, partial [Stylosanthes scabra]|nr:hypothetical protein [Stylosanthes scabra]
NNKKIQSQIQINQSNKKNNNSKSKNSQFNVKTKRAEEDGEEIRTVAWEKIVEAKAGSLILELEIRGAGSSAEDGPTVETTRRTLVAFAYEDVTVETGVVKVRCGRLFCCEFKKFVKKKKKKKKKKKMWQR